MTFQAQLVMLIWLPIVLLIFQRFSIHRAIIISFLIAWLFLPQRAGFAFQGLADYDRISATCYGIILGVILFHSQDKIKFKLSWIDIPIFLYCLSGLLSSLSNNLGLYDGLSAVLMKITEYGLPYFLGRLYLTQAKHLSELAKGIVISGIIYIPFCGVEVIIGPQLHRIVYGYFGMTDIRQSLRFGGWRPSVFMRHGLSVGMWMMAATLIAIWLWQSGTLKKLWGFSLVYIIPVMVFTCIVIKSTGAYVYLAFGIMVLLVAKYFKNNLLVVFLSLAIIFYLSLNVTGNVTAATVDRITDTLGNVFPASRVQSLEFRLDNEQVLLEKALNRPLLGWGGWGRNRVVEEMFDGTFKNTTVTDSLWIIAFGQNGIVGLVSIFAMMLVPPLYFCFKYPPKLWLHPQVAPIAVLNTILVLYALDCTLNDQFNPVFVVISGAISGFLVNNGNQINTIRKRKIIRQVPAKQLTKSE